MESVVSETRAQADRYRLPECSRIRARRLADLRASRYLARYLDLSAFIRFCALISMAICRVERSQFIYHSISSL